MAGIDGAASIDIDDRGKGEFALTVYDKTGEVLATRIMRGDDNWLD